MGGTPEYQASPSLSSATSGGPDEQEPGPHSKRRKIATPPTHTDDHETTTVSQSAVQGNYSGGDGDILIAMPEPRRVFPAAELLSDPDRTPRQPTGPGLVHRRTVPTSPTSLMSQSSGAAGYTQRLRHALPGPPKTPSIAGSESTTTTDSGLSGKRRRTSPVKRMADLKLADKPVVSDFLDDASQLPPAAIPLYQRLRRISIGRDILPRAIQDDVAASLTVNEDPYLPESSLYHHSPTSWHPRTAEQQHEELGRLRHICELTRFCNSEQVSEPTWNARVHSPLLELALETFFLAPASAMQQESQSQPTPPPARSRRGDNPVSFWDVTVATIEKRYIPQHTSGSNLEAKMVDFCMTLSSPAVQRGARAMLSREGREARSVNHTAYAPVCLRPIGVSIETKTPDGSVDEGKAQLSVWAAAYLLRVQSAIQTTAAMTTSQDRRAPVAPTDIPPLPMLLVSGSVWQLHFTIDRSEDIVRFAPCSSCTSPFPTLNLANSCVLPLSFY